MFILITVVDLTLPATPLASRTPCVSLPTFDVDVRCVDQHTTCSSWDWSSHDDAFCARVNACGFCVKICDAARVDDATQTPGVLTQPELSVC